MSSNNIFFITTEAGGPAEREITQTSKVSQTFGDCRKRPAYVIASVYYETIPCIFNITEGDCFVAVLRTKKSFDFFDSLLSSFINIIIPVGSDCLYPVYNLHHPPLNG